jgi:hypothetical protein
LQHILLVQFLLQAGRLVREHILLKPLHLVLGLLLDSAEVAVLALVLTKIRMIVLLTNFTQFLSQSLAYGVEVAAAAVL